MHFWACCAVPERGGDLHGREAAFVDSHRRVLWKQQTLGPRRVLQLQARLHRSLFEPRGGRRREQKQPPPTLRARYGMPQVDAMAPDRPSLGGVLVKIEMRRKAAASHTLLNRHFGERIPPPQSHRVPPGTRPPTPQRQDFFFLTVGGRWAAPKSPKYVLKRPTEHRKRT